MATRKSKTATLDPGEKVTAPAAAELALAAGAEAADETAELSPAGEGQQWYVIHTYSGYENKVKANLEHRIETMDARGLILQVVIPTEDEIEIRDGQRRTVSKKIFPGYVLVQMIELKEGDEASNKAWYVVRNTPGVTGFVGSGPRPVPLDDNEVKQILRQMRVEEPRVKVGFQVGQSVRIIDGPFIDFAGQVNDINLEKGKVKVLVSFFGRETPVELDFLEVERL
ncbi:MAG TPA: transcription termination/antitermination protein NusG [Dehalococcoidia bacterium]|nr:transcription termination/antitermination protein NusG [Dehalococcoidia bacterium]